MVDHYHTKRGKSSNIPAILGLTASPVVRAKPDQLRLIETNLNAIARTPIMNRIELLKHVYPPLLKRVIYSSSHCESSTPAREDISPPSIEKILDIDLDFSNGSANDAFNIKELEKAIINIEEGSDHDSCSGGSVYYSDEDTHGTDDSSDRAEAEIPEGEFESIDPRTGEPFVKGQEQEQEQEFEIIDPRTGEVLVPGRPPSPDTVSVKSDSYEVIDPRTGETYRPSSRRESRSRSRSSTPPIIPRSPPRPPVSFSNSMPTMSFQGTLAFESLKSAYMKMDIEVDPYIVSLRQSPNPDERRIQRLISGRGTYCQTQMKGLVTKSCHIRKEYGVWASEWYIKEALSRMLRGADDAEGEGAGALMDWDGDRDEKTYLKSILRNVTVPTDVGSVEGRLTNKMEKLIQVLLEEYHNEEDGEAFAGLVFVEQRVEVRLMQQILETHNSTKDLFRCGTIVGGAQHSARAGRGVYELVSPKDQVGVIESFRAGKVNLLISTSVVEEGLDIPACHLVVCFSLPQNLKSFIQRRGRARRAKSTYVLMFEEGDKDGSVEYFEKREREMIEEYLDETRQLTRAAVREEDPEEDDNKGIWGLGAKRKFIIERTGASLNLESAVQHLYHFCDCLPQGQYMNINPVFTCEIDPDPRSEDGTRTSTQLFRAKVLLPNCIPPKARHAKSKLSWPTEKMAKRDAALEAYIGLYRLKLVDDHLMPLLRTDADIDAMKDVEKRPSKVPVESTMNPWADMKWDDDTVVYSTKISLRMPKSDRDVEINMLTSVECPPVADIQVFWTNDEIGKVTVGNTICLGVNPEIVEWGRQQTFELLFNIFGSRMKMGVMEFPYLFVPLQPGEWDCSNLGRITNALDAYNELGPSCDIVINDAMQSSLRLVVKKWRTDLSPLDVPALVERYGRKHIIKDQPVIEAVRITRRRDFLHEEANQSNSESTILLLPQYCTLERIPWRFFQLGLFIPGIIRRVEVHLIAADLQATLLAPVGINDLSLIVTSICASAAREAVDYQRFEFLGDSVLKFLTSVNLVDEHPLWHEGYLARKKDQLVSNARLAKAAQDKRLSRWIITSIFTGIKWAPHYMRGHEAPKDADEVEPPSGKNELSTKILADVVESLIGASYLEGGYGKALKCINLFVPENELKPLPLRINSMVSRAAMLQPSTSKLGDLEKLLGYTFRHKALLVEAITHPSFTSDMSSISYQRLEFLGDALLDMLVVPWLFHHEKTLSHINMHLFKASVVNADFLAFLSLGYSANVGDATVESNRRGRRPETFKLVPKDRKIQLWKFVRHQHPEMASAQTRVWHQYDAEGFRDIIQKALNKSDNYPWTALCGLDADKFFSDIVEALLGAIFVDSGGDFGPVTEFAERLGILRTLRRLVRDNVDVTHPIKKLGELVAADGQGTVTYLPGLVRGKHTCTVQINQKVLVKIDDGSSRAVARVRAAEAGYHTLLERKSKSSDPS